MRITRSSPFLAVSSQTLQQGKASPARDVPSVAVTEGSWRQFSDPGGLGPRWRPTPGSAARSQMQAQAGRRPPSCPQSLRDEALLEALRDANAEHTVLSYDDARRAMFSVLDNHGGWAEGVYTGREVFTFGFIPDHKGWQKMNTEHIWPRSQGLSGTHGTTDLHHLFPTDTSANEHRGHLPFGVVEETTWQSADCKLGRDCDGEMVFEPPDHHKGNVARAMFYIAAMYDLSIPPSEEAALKLWNELDPVDDTERQRNDTIGKLQGNTNPFITDPSLVDRIADF